MDAIVRLYQAQCNIDAAVADTIRRHVTSSLSAAGTHQVYIAHAAGAAVGAVVINWLTFSLLQAPECYVSELVVLPTARGSGVGTTLMLHVEREARRRGCGRITLNCPRQSAAYRRGFYVKLGYVERLAVANFVCDIQSEQPPPNGPQDAEAAKAAR